MVPNVQQAFDAEGNPTDPKLSQQAKAFLDELLWITEAIANHNAKRSSAHS